MLVPCRGVSRTHKKVRCSCDDDGPNTRHRTSSRKLGLESRRRIGRRIPTHTPYLFPSLTTLSRPRAFLFSLFSLFPCFPCFPCFLFSFFPPPPPPFSPLPFFDVLSASCSRRTTGIHLVSGTNRGTTLGQPSPALLETMWPVTTLTRHSLVSCLYAFSFALEGKGREKGI